MLEVLRYLGIGNRPVDRAEILRGFCTDRSKTKNLSVPRLEQILALQEKETLARSFGEEIDVGFFPREVTTALANAHKNSINIFEPHFLPSIDPKTLLVDEEFDKKYPLWEIKPSGWHRRQILNPDIKRETAILPGVWILIDKTPKPDINGVYENDPLGKILKNLRGRGVIQTDPSIPLESRFNLSIEEVAAVGREVAKILRVEKEHVRLPTALEFNMLGNLYYRQWGQTTASEWLVDKFGEVGNLFGGNKVNSRDGLGEVSFQKTGFRSPITGFRFIIVFPPRRLDRFIKAVR